MPSEPVTRKIPITQPIPVVQHVQSTVEGLLGVLAVSKTCRVLLEESGPDGAGPNRPVMFAVFNLRPADHAEGSEKTVVAVMVLEFEVLDGGPSRIKMPSAKLDTGTTVLYSLPKEGYKLRALDQLQGLPRGSVVTISSRIAETEDEVFLDLTAEDRAVLQAGDRRTVCTSDHRPNA